VPLDVDAVTSPRYTREPLSLSLHLIEVSHISIRKSSITLRIINMSSKDGISPLSVTKLHIYSGIKQIQSRFVRILAKFD